MGFAGRAVFGYTENDAWGTEPEYDMESSSSILNHDERQPSHIRLVTAYVHQVVIFRQGAASDSSETISTLSWRPSYEQANLQPANHGIWNCARYCVRMPGYPSPFHGACL